jgi:hypothetical protein
MSPEQIVRRGRLLDRTTDVYSLAVTLYECLTLRRPFAGTSAQELFDAILNSDPVPANQLNRSVSPELWIILEKAMDQDRERRYRTALDLAEDLRRFRRDEPVVARPPSRWYRLRKFTSRNRVLVAGAAATFTVLVLGIVGTWVSLGRESLALGREQEQRKQAEASLQNFNRLAVVVRLEEAEQEQKTLFPAWPDKIPALNAWLENHGRPLRAELSPIRQTLQQLEEDAVPQTKAEEQKNREDHPRYQEYLAQQKRVTALQRMMDVAEGKAKAGPTAVAADAPKEASKLNKRAWPLVNPDRKTEAFGQEAMGLALIQRGIALLPADDDKRHMYLDTLAWALFANGRFTEARAESKNAWEAAPDKDKTEHQGFRDKLATAIADAGKAVAKAREELASLEEEVNHRQSFRFAGKADGFLHKTLRALEKDLLAFLGKKGALSDVEARLSWAKRVEQLTLGHP